MLIAPEKTEVMILTPGMKVLIQRVLRLNMEEKSSSQPNQKKNLGIIVNDKLTFKEHILQVRQNQHSVP